MAKVFSFFFFRFKKINQENPIKSSNKNTMKRKRKKKIKMSNIGLNFIRNIFDFHQNFYFHCGNSTSNAGTKNENFMYKNQM